MIEFLLFFAMMWMVAVIFLIAILKEDDDA